MQDTKAQAVLIRIAQEFPIAIVGLQLLPEAGDIARAMHGGSAMAAAMVRHDIVKHDETAVADELAIEQEISFHPFIPMIAIDEEQIDRLLPQRAANGSHGALAVGGAVDEMKGLPTLEKEAKEPAIHDEEIDANDGRNRGNGMAE
jgi:hypothetical protein